MLYMNRFKSIFSRYLVCLMAVILVVTGTACGGPEVSETTTKPKTTASAVVTEKDKTTEAATEKETTTVKVNKENLSSQKVSSSSLPKYSGKAYVTLNGNLPAFTPEEITSRAYENYSSLDGMGRCGVAMACCGREIMPAEGEKRGSISSIKPSGWHQATYDCISGKYLYNRCHLIGWQLSAENANPRNLITGTKNINISGMLPFENLVADYIQETGNHVMYRVTPIFEGNNLVASVVQLEAYSVEDGGDSVCFNVYCFNVQPNVCINYANGYSWSANVSQPTETQPPAQSQEQSQSDTYILNTRSKKIHHPDCPSVAKMSPKNKKEYKGNIQDLLKQGYTKCGNCF